MTFMSLTVPKRRDGRNLWFRSHFGSSAPARLKRSGVAVLPPSPSYLSPWVMPLQTFSSALGGGEVFVYFNEENSVQETILRTHSVALTHQSRAQTCGLF